MPGVNSVQISLSDALQVNGKPLHEEQLWSVLCQSTEAIQDVFLKGQALADDGPSCVVSPYTLLLCADGKVTFTESIDVSVPDLRNFIPPEGLAGINHFSEPVVEKMYIYALGQTLRWCSDYNRSITLPAPPSHNLQSLVSSMCSQTPEQRISLVHILEACAIHARMKGSAVPYSLHVTRLNKIILGSVSELDRIGQDEDQYYSNSNGNNNSRMDDRSYFKKDSYQQHTAPDFEKPPVHSRSPQKRPHSFLGSSSQRQVDDEPDMMERSSRRPPRTRDNSHYSSSTADSHESMEPLHPRKRSNLEESYLSDEDEGRSYHLSDIISSPDVSPSRYSKKSYQSSPRSRRGPRSPSRWDRQRDFRSSQVYDRLRERRERLGLLREQLGIRQPNPPPVFPVYCSESDAVQSDIDDIKRNIRELRRKSRSQKSLASMESAQEGSFHPDHLTPAASLPSIPNALYEEGRRNHHFRFHSPPRSPGVDPYWSDNHVRQVNNRPRYRNGDLEDRRRPRHTPKKLKKLFGPEFVVMSSAPNETMDMVPSMMCKAGKVPPERKQVVVVLLNGKRLHLMCDLGTSGQELFDMVASHLDLSERFYFGLAFIKEGEYLFLDLDSKLYKVGPDSWRAEMKKGTLRSTISRDKLTLFFRVKYYIDNVNILKNLDDTTRHNLYLQLRRDILEERVKCNDGESLQLASLALQVEMGEYDHERMSQNYFLPEHYVPAGTIEGMGVSAIRRKLPILHQAHEDMGDEEAEFEFLLEARKLSEYGIHFHKVSKSKKSSKQAVWLGICARGIIVYDKSGITRSQLHAHPWPMTKKVAFKRKKFVVEPNDSSGSKFVHYTDNYKKGKYLLQLCKAQHRFHMTMRNKSQVAQRFHEEFRSPIKYDTPVRQPDFGYDVQFSDDDDEEIITDDFIDDYNPPLQNREPYPVTSEPVLNMMQDPPVQYQRSQSHMEEERRGGETLPEYERGRALKGRRSHLSKARSVDTGRQLLDDGDDPVLGRERPLSSQVRSRGRNYDSYSEDDFSSQEELNRNDDYDDDEIDWPNIVSNEYMRSSGPADEDVEEGPYATIDSIRERKREAARQRSRMNGSVRQQRGGGSDQPYVVDTSIHTRGEPYRKQAVPQNFTSPLSDTLQDRLNEMPSPEVPERDIVIVTLKKDPHLGLGLTIIGGENSGSLDLGIFVREVTEDGPADRDGQIYKGDRIISINGQSLEGVSHKVAVEVIQKTSEVVQLILSQPRRNRKSPQPKLAKVATPPEGPYANIVELRRHSMDTRPKLPPDRQPQRSHSTVSASGSMSRQTPPTKPKRKPQSFGSSYSLVNSDSEGVNSETDNGNSKRQPANKERLPAKKKEQPLSHSAQETGKRSKGRSGRPEGNGGTRQIPHFPPQNLSEALQTLEGDTHMVLLPHGEEEVNAQLERVIRGLSPTLDMDFDDNISDDVPTPESSELEDLFGDEDEKKRKPDLNLRKSMNMSPSLSADADKREEGNSKRDLGTSERGPDTNTEEDGGDNDVELVASALKPGDTFTVQLKKKNASLGISVTGGINTSVKLGGIYVKTMVPGGAAEEEGQIRAGDRVLQVDKYSLEKVTHKQAVEILRKVPEVSVLHMERGHPPARVNTLPPTPVHFKENHETHTEGTVTTDAEQHLNMKPSETTDSTGQDYANMNGEVAGNVTEEETLNENTLRFSPPPDQKIVDSKKALEDASTRLDSLRAGHDGHSPGTMTPTIEALNDENGESSSEEEEESGGDEEEESEDYKSNEDSGSDAAESDVPSDDFPEDDDLYAEIASPALSTREADTLTPTAHLMTPTRGLFGARNQASIRGQQNWVHRKSIDDDDRYSSAISESTNARSPSPSSSNHPEDEGNNRSGFQVFRRPGDAQSGDADSSSFRRVMRSPFDSGRKPLEIEPSILPVMEEEPSELDGISTKAEQQEKLNQSENPKSPSPPPETNDQSSYQPTMVTMDSNLMSPMSTLDSVGALMLTQTLTLDPDASSDVKIPDVPYATIDNCFEAELSKDVRGLGFSVQGGVGAHKDPRLCTARIKKIFPGQAAAKSGLLEEGDIILAVNGVHIHDAVHSDVVTKLRACAQTFRLLICRPSQEELDTLLQQETKKPLLQRDPSPRKDIQPLTVTPGARVTSPISSPLLSPTGKSEMTSPHNSSIEFGSNELLSVSESSPRRALQKDDTTEVTLVKPVRGGLGFTVAGGVNTGGCYIKDIITDPALSDGRLMKGDKILRVNGKETTKMNHFEAVTFLRMTPREVTLTIKRPVNRYDLASPSPEKQPPASVAGIKSDAISSRATPPPDEEDEDDIEEEVSDDNEPLRTDEIERLTPKHVLVKSKAPETREVSREQLQEQPDQLDLKDSLTSSATKLKQRDNRVATQDTLNGEKLTQEDSDIDLGDLSAEDSWEDLSSENDSGEDLDAILAALNPLQAAKEEQVKNNVHATTKTDKHKLEPPSQTEDKQKVAEKVKANEDDVSAKTSNQMNVEPPPVPEAPPPPLSPTTDHSFTPPLLPNSSGESLDASEERPEDIMVNQSLRSEMDKMSLRDGDGEPRGEEDESRNSEKRRREEDAVEQSVLDDLLNQDDSIDDITFADMLSSGDDYDEEESDLPEEEEETDLPIKAENYVGNVAERQNQDESNEDLNSLKNDSVSRANILSSPRKSLDSDLLIKDVAQLSVSDQLSVLAPSPVVVNPPTRKFIPPPPDLTDSISDSEASSSLALPSIEDDAPQNFTPRSQRSVKAEEKAAKETSQERMEASPPSLEDSIASEFSVSGEFSFGDDDALPMPSSPKDKKSIREAVEELPKMAEEVGRRVRSDVIPKPAVSQSIPQNDRGDNDSGNENSGEESLHDGDQLVQNSPALREDRDNSQPLGETSPGNALPERSRVTHSENLSAGDALPPILGQSERKREVTSPRVISDLIIPKSVEQNRSVPDDGDSVVPSRTITPLRRPPSTISEGLSATEGGVYWVEMEKPSTGGLGFSLVGAEKGGKTSVFIKTVTPGGITDLDGRIKVGDKMLQVNGQSTVGMTQKKVISLLRKAQGTVKLALASAKPPSRPASFIATDVGADTDPEPPTVPPLNLPRDLGGGSDSDHERKLEENNKGELSSMESFTESKYTESQLKAENHSLQNDQLITTVTYDSSLLHTLSFENLRSLSLLTPPPPEFDASDSTDRDTDSDIDSTADLPDDSLLDLLDDSGNAVAMETALRATRQFGKVLKDKIQGKDDISFGSDIGFPLSSENSSLLPSEGESSNKSPRGHSEGGASVITDQELAEIQILQVPSSSCKLYSGKQLKSIITSLQKKIDNYDPEEEFKMLRQVKAADACEVARKPENRDKNRFRNVLPYDTTRVILQTEDSDYVNASHVHVKVASTEYHYIACQGPLPQTTKDFWAMVWEQGVEVIAMVTLDFENGKVKCHKYWPSSKDEVLNIDEFEIKLEEVSKLEHFHIRQLLMTHKESKVTHHVTHLNFTSWPDHSVPDSATPLLRYIRYMRKLSGEFNPVVVHCSAGIGRTGTLMTIDSLLNMIEADQEFKIEEIVKDLRLQRQGMIQTKDQYLFCYKAAVEALQTLL